MLHLLESCNVTWYTRGDDDDDGGDNVWLRSPRSLET